MTTIPATRLKVLSPNKFWRIVWKPINIVNVPLKNNPYDLLFFIKYPPSHLIIYAFLESIVSLNIILNEIRILTIKNIKLL